MCVDVLSIFYSITNVKCAAGITAQTTRNLSAQLAISSYFPLRIWMTRRIIMQEKHIQTIPE